MEAYEVLLIKAAHNGSANAESTLYQHHKKQLSKSLHKYNSLHLIIEDLSSQIEYIYRMAIHKYNIESKITFISFASWFIKNHLERKCSYIHSYNKAYGDTLI